MTHAKMFSIWNNLEKQIAMVLDATNLYTDHEDMLSSGIALGFPDLCIEVCKSEGR